MIVAASSSELSRSRDRMRVVRNPVSTTAIRFCALHHVVWKAYKCRAWAVRFGSGECVGDDFPN